MFRVVELVVLVLAALFLVPVAVDGRTPRPAGRSVADAAAAADAIARVANAQILSGGTVPPLP